MFKIHCRCINCITPPHILKKLLDNSDNRIRDAALRTLMTTARLRGQRSVFGLVPAAAASAQGRRTIFDCANNTFLPGASIVRTEDGPAASDASANRAFDGLGETRAFYKEIFDRDSLDGRGMRLNAYVHYDNGYNNAFWSGREMVFGDGDGVLFTDFTKSLDVIGHELTHGVTEFTAALEYHDQSGALNESMSDVFGSLVKQWVNKQTADKADWLIGAEVFTPTIGADALRSMKAPGTAYNSSIIGRDPQPDNMSKYVNLPNTLEGDNGGVHINSGIPNKAFYLVATAIGGNAWDAPGHIWYETLTRNCGPQTQFQDFADATFGVAGRLYGASSSEQQAVRDAWREVGIQVAGGGSIRPALVSAKPARRGYSDSDASDSLAALQRRVDDLAKAVDTLTKKMHAA